jgi:multiple sugar transport system permease protein
MDGARPDHFAVLTQRKMAVIDAVQEATSRLTSIRGKVGGDRFVRRSLLLPVAVVIALLTTFPFLFSLVLTFTNMRLLASSGLRFVGFENWGRLFADRNFHIVLRNTLVFVVAGVTLQYVLGLGLALLLNEDIRGRRFFRISLFLPMMMSPVAVSYVIGKMLFSESYGPINDLLSMLGLPLFTWTLSPAKSMAVLVMVDTWQWTPFFILVLLAGLQSISPELYEAARVDGATPRQMFLYITFPLLMPLCVTAILIRSLEAFKVLDLVRVVTGGGPGNSTESVTLFAYDIGLKGGDIAYASTVAYALLITVIISSVVFLGVARRITPRTGE